MRPGRAVVLCLIAVVLVQAGFFAGAPPDSSGNRFVLRGARIPSMTSGTRTAAVPDGKPNAPGLIVQDLSPALRTGWDPLSFPPGRLPPPSLQLAVGTPRAV